VSMGPVMRPAPRPFSALALPDMLSVEPDAMEAEVLAVRVRRDEGRGFGFVTPLALLGLLARDGFALSSGMAPEEMAAAGARARLLLLLRVEREGPDSGGE
jgi:hypothetical protein